MQSYKQLQDQIKQLQKQADDLRKKELSDAINKIKSIMNEYNITINDLGLSSRKKRTAKKTRVIKPLYKDPVSGKTWSGRGRSPVWFDNKNKDKFLIK